MKSTHLSTSRQIPLFLSLLFISSACSPKFSPSPPVSSISPCDLPRRTPHVGIIQSSSIPSDALIEENLGQVCFYRRSPTQFRVSVSTLVCLPTGCTLVYQRTGVMKIDSQKRAIRFSTRFAVKTVAMIGASCGCDADCGGAGWLEFETGQLSEGVYAVMLGNLKLGDLVIPANTDPCFYSEATAIPYTTPVPTATKDWSAYPQPVSSTMKPSPYPYP